MSARLLIVSESGLHQRSLVTMVECAGFAARAVRNRHEAIRCIGADEYFGILVDLISKGSCGVSIARYLKAHTPESIVLVFTRSESDGHPFAAFPIETCDPQCWPSNVARPLVDIVKSLQATGPNTWKTDISRHTELHLPKVESSNSGNRTHVSIPRSKTASESTMLIGDSPQMKDVRTRIAEVADSELTVLIRGESGTGKTVTARVIHETSGRRNSGNLSRINCPAVPESLLESELFGYEKGAFTGADRQKPGRLELAGGGTVFLDEIGAISLGVQAKLLEVLEAKQYFRVGGRESIQMDARLVAATNANLDELVECGAFRADLMFRLDQFPIQIPPLRERPEDIPILVDHFLHIHSEKYGHHGLQMPQELMCRLHEYAWPGNVRELETVIARFCLTNNASLIAEILDKSTPPIDVLPSSGAMDSLHSAERRAVYEALERSHWNQRKTAAALGISYSALRRRIARYGILAK